MELGDVAADVFPIQMCVDFCSGDAFMSKHLLYGAQVRTPFYEVRGEGVSEGVRTDCFGPFFT